ITEKFRLIQPAARYQSGEAGYTAVNADGEFNDKTHAAWQRKHFGLHWGFMQFNQRSGALGRVLSACERRAPVAFRQVFGAERDRAIAMLYDRCVEMGNAAARAFVVGAVTPLKDPAAIASALKAAGHDSPQSFQRSLGLAESPQLGPKAHAALIAALRALDAK